MMVSLVSDGPQVFLRELTFMPWYKASLSLYRSGKTPCLSNRNLFSLQQVL